MRWFRPRRPPGVGETGGKEAERATRAHLAEFARTRVGVEAYVEPETRSTPMTVVLVAATGEWTRRRVPGARAARQIAAELGIPVYDVDGSWVISPDDERAHGLDERIPVRAMYDDVLHWEMIMRELAS